MSRWSRWGVGGVLLLTMGIATAAIIEGGKGMLFGVDHAFNVTAADGWVLDNENGRQQGLHMLFYPKGETLADSQVIVYGRSTPRGSEKRGVKEVVQSIVTDFYENGSGNYKALAAEPIMHRSGSPVTVYHYTGDQWGNYEAGAYFVEENTINFLVFHARTEEGFRRYYADFAAMVRGYSNAFMNIKPTSDEAFSQLLLLSKQDLASKAGQEYETAAIKSLGSAMTNVAGGCASFFQPGDDKNFQVIFRINQTGDVAEAYTNPNNAMASCFVGLIGKERYPVHQFDDFLLHLNMVFQRD